ncbi:MAG: L-seryl-tRNA(Sec) selenium transferase [Enhygromyxa sp.]
MSAADQLRKLPKVDRVLEHPALVELGLRRGVVRRLVVEALDAERERTFAAAQAGAELHPPLADLEQIAARVRARLDEWLTPHPLPVLNATGVVLHTNLGRAPLSAEASAAALAAAGSCDLELDLDTGKRGSRLAHLRPLLAALFEAEDALVVNNGAAALLLACSALAAPGGVALSRGQHVEIGDGFRVAEMAAAGGVPVIPIGSTNRTHLRDYEAALERASALLWVHRSNFEQRGFVTEVELAALGQLASERGVPLIADLGSGLIDAELAPGEPSVSSYLEQGATIVGFSGDKLLGGPQAGLLAGSAEAVARCRRHPLARALRCGKLALAGLHATALAHLRPGAPKLPIHAMLAVSPGELRQRAERLCAALGWAPECVRESVATIGGGSVPGRELPSVALVPKLASAHDAASRLRRARPAMIARVRASELWVDLRTLVEVDDATVVAALRLL